MGRIETELRHLVKQIRLAASETLIRWAIAVSPPESPETADLHRAVHWLFTRRLRSSAEGNHSIWVQMAREEREFRRLQRRGRIIVVSVAFMAIVVIPAVAAYVVMSMGLL